MPCLRPLLGAALLSLSPSLACIENTIELESMEGSSSAADEGSGTTTAHDSSASVTVTVTTTASTTTVGPADSSDVDVDSGPRLDFAVDPESDTLLLAVDTIVSFGLPLQGIVWLERGGGGTVDLQLQWLSLDQGSTTEPRKLVGDVYAYPGIPVDPDGSFLWDTGVLLVPAAANPITGSDITISMSLAVEPAGSPYCGAVGGDVLSPIRVPLDGSTHAMTSVASVDELPLEFPWSCQ